MGMKGQFVDSANIISERHRPDYGDWWKNAPEVDDKFFHDIFINRVPQHDAFSVWVQNHKIYDVCEIGCGHGIRYANFFPAGTYTGIDISMRVIGYCINKYPKQNWTCEDFLNGGNPGLLFDLVFCHGTIENMYDMDLLIRNMTAISDRYLYITGFKGWFPDLEEHEYKWDERYKCYDNKLSPKRVKVLLDELGFKSDIFPQKTNKTEIPFETVIIAERI